MKRANTHADSLVSPVRRTPQEQLYALRYWLQRRQCDARDAWDRPRWELYAEVLAQMDRLRPVRVVKAIRGKAARKARTR